MADWLEALSLLEREGMDSVLVTVLTARGSTPREAGTKMVITQHAVFGTIGGGQLELEATHAARELLVAGNPMPETREYPLGPALNQCCGGFTSLLFEPILAPSWNIVLFGAGHVGKAIINLLVDLPCRVSWVDTREDAFGFAARSTIRTVSPDRPENFPVPSGAQVLIMTHSHAQDYDVTVACLRRNDLASVGLIGSETKRARFVSRMKRDGVPPTCIDRLRCPIGLPGIEGKLPAEIAIAVVAQLMQERKLVESARKSTPQTVAGHE
jgi:xanthine dehydrogenase accessory factor